MKYWCLIAAALLLILTGCAPVHERCEFASVNDRPLLETPQQVRDAYYTGYSTFTIGSEYFVVEQLPKEYIDWSAWRVRLP